MFINPDATQSLPAYKIDINNRNFIRALKKYCSRSEFIDSSGKRIENLDSLQTALIQYYPNSQNLLFPSSDRLHKSEFEPDNPWLNTNTVIHQTKELGAVISYIEALDNQKITRIQPYYWPPQLDLVANEQNALMLISQINKFYTFQKNKEIAGMIHFKSINQIILQTKTGTCLLLDYSKEKMSIEEVHVTLDLDDGVKCDDGSPELTFEMNKFFRTWKENNYQGDLFPKHQSGINSLRMNNLIQRLDRSLEQLSSEVGRLQLKINQNDKYFHVWSVGRKLLESLKIVSDSLHNTTNENFITEDINQETLDKFKNECHNYISNVKATFAPHRGFNKLNPLIRAVLGVIAVITIIPAIVTSIYSTHGYKETFFSNPPTRSLTKLEEIEKDIDENLSSLKK